MRRLEEGERLALHDRLRSFVSEFHDAHGYAPTIREVAKAVDLSPVVTLYHLRMLRAAGVVDWKDGLSRTLHVVP